MWNGVVNGRRGRRSGATETKAAILAAARRRFAGEGFHGATIREIAHDAGVDAALLAHYFGGKAALFAAAVEVPVPAGDGPLLRLWEDPPQREAALALLRSAATYPPAAAMLRDMLMAGEPAGHAAALRCSEALGLAMARHILRLEPIASDSPEQLCGPR